MQFYEKFGRSNLIEDKTFAFALRIVRMCKFLEDRKESIISKQVLRCGTAIGAMVREAQFGETKRDFVHKMMIALKEANETCYWLEILFHSQWIERQAFLNIHSDILEILKLLTVIVKKAKRNNEELRNVSSAKLIKNEE
jgi:four helix bundle protein